MRSLVWVLVVVSACKRPAASKPVDEEKCLALPAAVRDVLVASPDGESLYWEELARNYDFYGDMDATWHLVRYDLKEHRASVVVDDIVPPIVFVGGQVVVPRVRYGTPRLSLVGTDGHLQDLTSAGLRVRDVELIDSHTIAFLADGLGLRAVHTLDLAELRSYPLLNADTLLSTASGNVLARVDDEIVIVDPKTKQTSRVPYPHKSVVLGDQAFLVDGTSVIQQDVRTASPKPAITKPGDWQLVYQGDSVLARTPVEDEKSFAYLLTAGSAKPLPTVLGGASIIRTAQVGSRTWALIAHNTSNYIGDVANTHAEADICLLPAADEVTYPTREVPARFVERSQALFDAVKALSPAATLQIMESDDEPVTLHIFLHKEHGAANIAAMRKRTRQVHDDVTRLLSDREIRTSVEFDDRRVGVERWSRDRLRDRTVVGMGDVQLSSPEDFDFEVASLENKEQGDKITCKGTIRNLGKAIDDGLDVQCTSNREHAIHIDKLGANESRAFDQTFTVGDEYEGAHVQIVVHGKPSPPRFADVEDRNGRLFDVAIGAFDATGLWLEQHTITDGVRITLHAEPEFAKVAAADQEAAIKAAYDRYVAFRSIYELDPATPVTLHVDVERRDLSFDYDGTRFDRD